MTDKPKADDRTLDRLLGGDPGMSVTESEAVLEAALSRERKKRPIWFRLGMPAGFAFAAAALFVWLAQPTDDFSVRGKEEVNLVARCEATCKVGDQLHFEVEGARYFGAFMIAPDATVRWIAPLDENGTSMEVGAERHWLAISAEIEGPTGMHRVLGVFSDTPLTRDQIKTRIDGGQGPAQVVERKVEVLAK